LNKMLRSLPIPVILLAVLYLVGSSLPSLARVQEPPAKPPALDAKTRVEVVQKVGELLVKFYIFPDKAKDMQALLTKKLKGGEYDKVDDVNSFARTLTQDLQSVSQDRHIRVTYGPDMVKRIRARNSQSEAEREKERKESIERERRANFGFQKLELFDGNIGYLDLRFFSGRREAGETAVAAMNFLANADAVIIDLRQNGGGSPAMIQLISTYFLNDSTHLNSFENRGEDTLQQFWSLPYVPGKTMFDTDLYILTSRRTFSAAEEFTYNLKNLKRATIVGETTGGGAHPGGTQIVNDEFMVWVPTGRAVNPITRTNWEGTGIEPYIAVKPENALDKARAVALDKIIQKASDERTKAGLQWALLSLKASSEPAAVEPTVLQKYVGRYSQGEVTLENGELYAIAQGRKVKMIPVSPTYFVLEGDSEAHLEFVLDNEGKSYEIIVHLRDGGKQRLSRVKQ
jgi:C-terminal processing protease CtpA/Prc